MKYINRHKVFISYYHKDDKWYKKYLLHQKETNPTTKECQSIFENFSVGMNEIDDTNLSAEEVRRIIRKNYIKDSSVLVLLCGKNTKYRKFIDYELQAAMYKNSNQRFKPLGILVINLPEIENQSLSIGITKEELKLSKRIKDINDLNRDYSYLKEHLPYLPERLILNLTKNDVNISVVPWSLITKSTNFIKLFVDDAYKNRKLNNYDSSKPLKKNNN